MGRLCRYELMLGGERLQVAFCAGGTGHLLGCSLGLLSEVRAAAPHGADAALHPVAALLKALASRIGKIVGAFLQRVAGLLAAHRRKQHAETDAEPQTKQKGLHELPPMDVVCPAILGAASGRSAA